MRVLILGGTQFVGRHLVEAALAAGHQVTLFNRGKTNPGIYPDAEEIHGDRVENLDRLAGRSWDVVFDPSGYVPRVVRKSAELLRDRVERYVFVSSISVYSGTDAKTEADPVLELEDPTTEEIPGNYGGLKALCEAVVTEIYGDRGLNVRPGFIVGEYDPATRLPYLLTRYDDPHGARGSERLAGTPDQPVQIIHARDLADWMFGAVAQKLHGAYNLTGEPFPMSDLLDAIQSATARPRTVIYTGDAFLQETEVAPVDGLTYWVPSDLQGFMRVSVAKAVATGLTFLPLSEIVARTLAWVREAAPDFTASRNASMLLTPEREADLLAKWHAQA